MNSEGHPRARARRASGCGRRSSAPATRERRPCSVRLTSMLLRASSPSSQPRRLSTCMRFGRQLGGNQKAAGKLSGSQPRRPPMISHDIPRSPMIAHDIARSPTISQPRRRSTCTLGQPQALELNPRAAINQLDSGRHQSGISSGVRGRSSRQVEHLQPAQALEQCAERRLIEPAARKRSQALRRNQKQSGATPHRVTAARETRLGAEKAHERGVQVDQDAEVPWQREREGDKPAISQAISKR